MKEGGMKEEGNRRGGNRFSGHDYSFLSAAGKSSGKMRKHSRRR